MFTPHLPVIVIEDESQFTLTSKGKRVDLLVYSLETVNINTVVRTYPAPTFSDSAGHHYAVLGITMESSNRAIEVLMSPEQWQKHIVGLQGSAPDSYLEGVVANVGKYVKALYHRCNAVERMSASSQTEGVS